MHSGPTPPGQRSPVLIGNALHWKHVDQFTLLQAACLWAGIEPLNELEDLSAFPEAAAAYHLLARAIEDGRLVAYSRNPAPRTVIAPAGGQHMPDMLVSREELLELAGQLGDKPLFLYPISQAVPQGQTQRRSYSSAKLESWYRLRVKEWPADTNPPSRDEDWKAAKKEEGFSNVPRKAVRELRDKLAPEAWKRKGGRPRRK